jgi:hypothetical protein
MECPNHNGYILMINFIQVIHIITNSSFKATAVLKAGAQEQMQYIFLGWQK